MKTFATRIRLRTRIGILVILATLSASSMANTVLAPRHIQHEIPQAQLWGQGAYTWFGLKIYDAQLWVGEEGV
ncbi:MAG: hypothetical protein ACXU7D_05420, partial [Burkholderiaceae bacterium]